MTVRSKTGAMGRVEHTPGKPKRTHQGQSKRSKPRGTRKLQRGQGR
jgi:hypothetical protein